MVGVRQRAMLMGLLCDLDGPRIVNLCDASKLEVGI